MMGNNNVAVSGAGEEAELQPATPTPVPKPKIVRRQVIEKIRSLLECAICLEEFENPRVLPCHHTFCFQCLEQHCCGAKTFKCPNCNCLVYLKRGISELPADFRANSLQECLPDGDSDEDAAAAAAAAAAASIGDDPDAGAAAAAVSHPVQLPAFSTRTTLMGMLTCPVCSDLLGDPRLLHCGHSFCTKCLEFMTPVDDPVIYCPCCDGQTPLPGGVEQLQVDTDKRYMIQMFAEPAIRTETEAAAAADRLTPSGAAPSSIPPPADVPTREGDMREAAPPAPGTAQRQQAQPPRPIYTGMKFKELLGLIGLSIIALGLVFVNVNLFYPLLSHIILITAILVPILYLQGLPTRPPQESLVWGQYPEKIIGAAIGAAFLTSYAARTDEAMFYAVSGAVIGCVVMCWCTAFSGHSARISTRGFFEALGPKTVWFIAIGGLYGTGFGIFAFVSRLLYGGLLGAVIASQVVNRFKRSGIICNLSLFGIFITCRGLLLGSVTAAVLSQVVYTGSKMSSAVLTGISVGLGVGLVCGDIYVPMLSSYIRLKTQSLGYDATESSELHQSQGRLRERVLVLVGTVLGALIGYLVTGQVFAVFIGALLGMYLSEQWMRMMHLVFEKLLESYVHCVVGGVLGGVLGVVYVAGYYRPLCGPMVGMCVETFLFNMYTHRFTRET